MNKSNYIFQLKAIIEKEGISQNEMARRMGVTFAALNRWLNGHAAPRPSAVKAIEKLYRETVGYASLTPQAVRQCERRASRLRIRGLWSKIARNEALQNELLLEQTYNSTSIEGTTFSRNQTKVVLFDKVSFPDKSLVEHMEVMNHAAVLKDILQKRMAGPVDEGLILMMHTRLLQGIRADAGLYSKHERRIHGSDMVLTHPKDIPEEVKSLLVDWRKASASHGIEKIAGFHTRFELIHPFGDGNGRIGRLLMALQCLESDYPPVVIENARKAEYYDVLEYAQKKAVGPFVLFLADEMDRTHRLIKKFIRS